MSKYINPFTDIGFKKLFGRDASKEFLIMLLNELLMGEHHIEDLYFLDKEDHGEHVDDKGIIYDIYCRTSMGEYIIVEMQNRWHSNFLDRTLYYMGRAFVRQKDKPIPKEIIPKIEGNENCVCEEMVPYGSKYKLHTVYGIFLMNFKEHHLPEKFRTDAVIADRDTGTAINPHFRQIFFQFPYFKKELEECETLYERIIYTLKHMNTWDRMPEALKDQVLKRFACMAEVAKLSEADRIAYDRMVDTYWVNKTVEEDIKRQHGMKALQQARKRV